MVSNHVLRELEHERIIIKIHRAAGPYGYMNGRKYCARCRLAFEIVKPIEATLTRCPFCNMPLRNKPKYNKRHYIFTRINPGDYLAEEVAENEV